MGIPDAWDGQRALDTHAEAHGINSASQKRWLPWVCCFASIPSSKTSPHSQPVRTCKGKLSKHKCLISNNVPIGIRITLGRPMDQHLPLSSCSVLVFIPRNQGENLTGAAASKCLAPLEITLCFSFILLSLFSFILKYLVI